MKLNELIGEFSIYLTNEEKQVLDTIEGVTSLYEFGEREQVIIGNLIRKSVVSKVMYRQQPMVMRNEQ
jgi:hypothetical protein